MNINVSVSGKCYILDVEKAKSNGSLVESYPLNVGDVYIDPNHQNGSQILISALYVALGGLNTDKAYQLLGIGASTNSDKFFHELHTKSEIQQFLTERGYIYSHNISSDISKLKIPPGKL